MKGQTPVDVILTVVIIFALAIGIIITSLWYGRFVDLAQNTTELNSTATRQAWDMGQRVINMQDYVLLFLFVGAVIAMMIMGYFIPTDTIFFTIYVIILMIGVVVSFILSYVWTQISGDVNFALLISNFKITNYMMTNLGMLTTVAGGLAIIATYAKGGSPQ